jgi:hypothetical protein
MSDYTKGTNFAVKDGYTTGDPRKTVKGTEIDDEFNAIASAISSKADTASPTFTGTPAAPTAVAGTNTTQIATTAFVTTALQVAYPVGSIYMNATNNTNPATLLGFGTWTAFGAGRMPVGFNSEDPLFDTAEETGGSKDAIVVSHTHTATSTVTDPGHRHFVGSTDSTANDGSAVAQEFVRDAGVGLGPNTFTNTTTTGITVATTNASTGSSGTNANLPPYIVVYMWKRTA